MCHFFSESPGLSGHLAAVFLVQQSDQGPHSGVAEGEAGVLPVRLGHAAGGDDDDDEHAIPASRQRWREAGGCGQRPDHVDRPGAQGLLIGAVSGQARGRDPSGETAFPTSRTVFSFRDRSDFRAIGATSARSGRLPRDRGGRHGLPREPHRNRLADPRPVPRDGVRRRLLQYDEEQDLLRPLRLVNGYREYSEPDIASVRRIRVLPSAGLLTAVIARLLDCMHDDGGRLAPEA